jgi:uncharacterized membrane protein
MFYLKEFCKSLGESPLRGLSFLVCSCLLALGLTHRPWISSTLAKISPEKMVNPYFVTVLDGSVDAEKLTRIMDELPGVVAVTESTNQGKAKLHSLLGNLGSDYSLSANLLSFRTYRIVLSPSLSSESLEFIRSQAVKLGTREHLTATEIKYPELTSVMKTHPFYSFLARAGDWGVIGLLSLLWITTYWLCYDVFRSRSYIIERFQRKKMVAAKTLATGLVSVVLLFSALGLWHGTLKFFDLTLLLMVFSVFWTFSMQTWRWKPTL